MPARTGHQYLDGLRNQPREVFIGGERVQDVTTHQGLSGGASSIAALYEIQYDSNIKKEMVYTSPSTGDPVGLSFLATRTREDLVRRRVMMSRWAHTSHGMMGRTPDFLNVSIMCMAEAGDYFARNSPVF